jgi:hypothetical protein
LRQSKRGGCISLGLRNAVVDKRGKCLPSSPALRQLISKSCEIRSAKMPSPLMREPKRASLSFPPRMERIRFKTFSLRSGKWRASQSSKSGRTSVAVNAPMTASPVGVDAGVETGIGAIVPGNDRTRSVSQIDSLGSRFSSIRPSGLRLDLDLLEAFFEIARRSTPDDAGSDSLPGLHLSILSSL